MLSSDGVEYLYTYRDPHLTESYDTFAKGPAELAARDYTEKDLNDLIVGAVAKLDTPRKPRAEARELDRQYFCGITEAMKAADRKALCAVDAALLKEQAAGLADAMASLPPRYREVLLMKYYNGYSAQEIAGFLSATPDAVTQTLHRARKKLAEILEERGETP